MPRQMPFRTWLRLTLRLAFFLCVAQKASGETNNWFYHPWQIEDGLPDNIITGIGQTPDGFLWVATAGGLVRFDGNRFEEFSPGNIPGVPERNVRTLMTGNDGRIWLGRDDGTVIGVDSERSQVFTPKKDGLPNMRVRVLVEDGDGAVWAAYPSTRGIARIKDGKVDDFGVTEGLPVDDACRVAVDAKGQLWFAKALNLGVFRGGRFQTLVKMDEPATCIGMARKGGVWVVTATRLLKFEEGKPIEDKGKLPQVGVSQGVVLEDSSGGVWIGHSVANGLIHYNGSSFETVATSHPLINALLEDKEGNLWVGTGGGGLNRLRPRTLELLNADKGCPFPSVRSVCEDTNGMLWIATSDGVLVHQRPNGWDTITSSTNWPGGRADCVTVDHSGTVWIGTRYSGLYRYQENQFATWVAENEFTNTYIRSLFGSTAGDLWIATDNPQQILRLREGFLRVFDVPDARLVRAIAEDIHSNVWMASADGYLMRMGDGVAINETTNDLHRLISIRSLHATPDGSLWIGYGGSGLGRLKDGKYSRITTAQGLSDDFISAIASDNKGGLWLMGARGLFRVPLDQMNAIAEGRADHVRSIPYGRAEGVPNLQAYYDSCPDTSLGRDGRLRLAVRTGLAVIHTENLPDNTAPPPVLLDRFVVDGKTLALYNSHFPLRKQQTNGVLELNEKTRRLRLAPDHKKIEIHFAGLSFTAPENMEFRYRLENYEDEWNKGGDDRVASYSHLPAGDYRLRVIACNNSGVWNQTGATVAFTVAPFVWQTWSFRIVSLVAFTLSVIAIVRYVSFRRLQRRLEIIEKEAAVERERIRIARDIHDDLGDRLTTMSMLSGLVLKGRGNGAEPKHLEQISATARQATDALDEIVWAINPRNDVLPNVISYIAQFAVEFLRTANISCHIDVPDHPPVKSVTAEVRHNLFLAVKEALNNIARHSGATEVQLHIVVAEKSGTIVVEDNGKGFAEMPTSSGADGLRNMKQRMNEIGGQCSIESQPGKGTRVTFESPWLGKS